MKIIHWKEITDNEVNSKFIVSFFKMKMAHWKEIIDSEVD
jgi:hypothetical protein